MSVANRPSVVRVNRHIASVPVTISRMSARAIVKAVETRLRSAAVLNDPTGRVCGVQDSGQPPQNMGQSYWAVHLLGISGDDPNALSNDRLYSVGVTITARMGFAPDDRKGSVISTSGDLLDRAEAVADAMHMDYATCMNVANALIVGTQAYSEANGDVPPITTNGFVEPLRLGSIGAVLEKPGSWVGSKDSAEVLTVLVTMVGARRVRPLE